MTTWLGVASPGELLAGQTAVGPSVVQLRELAAASTPGRTGELIVARVAQMIDGTPAAAVPADEAERAVVALAEQFLIDAHGVDDTLVSALAQWYTEAEVVAIMFHLALVDGFTKFAKVFGPTGTGPAEGGDE